MTSPNSAPKSGTYPLVTIGGFVLDLAPSEPIIKIAPTAGPHAGKLMSSGNQTPQISPEAVLVTIPSQTDRQESLKPSLTRIRRISGFRPVAALIDYSEKI